MRADLCATLLHNPKILFLDEPTIGLDVIVKKQIREMIRTINIQEGVTVILTTHDMKDIDEICKRIIMIDKGRVIVDEPTEIVKRRFRGNSTITIVFDKTPEHLNVDNIEGIEWNDLGQAIITYNAAHVSSASIISDIVNKHKIIDITIKEPEIDDIIRNLYTQPESELII